MNASEKRETERQVWDDAAACFDNEPDHGLREPAVRAVWAAHLALWLPVMPVSVLDMGCGTGSLSMVLAELGHRVTGIDFSPKMIARAEEKAHAAGLDIAFAVMDAADPPLPAEQFDVIVCRHVLWMLPALAEVLQRWAKLLVPRGRLILIEGHWHTGAGLHAWQIVDALPQAFADVTVAQLGREPALWGGAVTDERYAVVAT